MRVLWETRKFTPSFSITVCRAFNNCNQVLPLPLSVHLQLRIFLSQYSFLVIGDGREHRIVFPNFSGRGFRLHRRYAAGHAVVARQVGHSSWLLPGGVRGADWRPERRHLVEPGRHRGGGGRILQRWRSLQAGGAVPRENHLPSRLVALRQGASNAAAVEAEGDSAGSRVRLRPRRVLECFQAGGAAATDGLRANHRRPRPSGWHLSSIRSADARAGAEVRLVPSVAFLCLSVWSITDSTSVINEFVDEVSGMDGLIANRI